MLILYKTTAHFAISYDSTFTGGGSAPDGVALAQSVADYCEYDLARLGLLFGGIMPPAASLPIQINLLPGAGGGSNNLMNNITCFCNLNTDPLGPPGVVVAELAEIFMTLQNRGWMAAWSTGEALSKVCGGLLYPSRAWLFSIGQQWLNSARPNWVDNVEQTDTDSVSSGCGTLFLNYLANQLNYRWTDIIAAGAPNTHTLAETASLLGASNAWTNFSNLISAHLPPGSWLPPQPTGPGQQPEPTDNPFPFIAPASPPILYLRHNLADNGASHTGPLSSSPDVIVKNAPVANPQAAYSTAASIASDTESDPYVVNTKDNYVYPRVWNRGAAATNVFATAYWSPPATLVAPHLWNLVGSAYYPDVPAGSTVEVSNPGITWPQDKIPVTGHYCFVATVGNANAPAPNPATDFATFDDYVNYIYAHNNITWRNFNVAASATPAASGMWRGFVPLPFFIVGAWGKAKAHEFSLETEAHLPEAGRLALQLPLEMGRALNLNHPQMKQLVDKHTDPKRQQRLHVPLAHRSPQHLGRIELPPGSAAQSHLLVHIPPEERNRTHEVVVRQLYRGREVGRITWLLHPERQLHRTPILKKKLPRLR